MENQKRMAAKPKPEHQRWRDLCADAQAALQELGELQADYQNDYDEMTERQQESQRGQLLSAICELDLASALETVEEAADIELP
jgi:hypothetical protein